MTGKAVQRTAESYCAMQQSRVGDRVGAGSINEFRAKIDLHLETEIIWWACWWNCKVPLEECQE